MTDNNLDSLIHGIEVSSTISNAERQAMMDDATVECKAKGYRSIEEWKGRYTAKIKSERRGRKTLVNFSSVNVGVQL